ncbi:hypothetical protein [Croceimicrobium hydrocarbonivorans]|uniref:Uncharacterized protein n=1 Tax=Croceimicrobium hydrocarbonivorans TaxID=2761580 RepID=A0A7H0VIF0_9FLAO|nr:hypothetical protein [Croceimicrobium hydrocarbonivorans]QNR25498.1 hypothetical protein H4K34_06565 [Croceimicrobium hydrocarbonivorans]
MMRRIFFSLSVLFVFLVQCSEGPSVEISICDKILADIQGKWKLEDSFVEIEISGDSVVNSYENPKDSLYFQDSYKILISKEIEKYGRLYKADSNEFFFSEITEYDTTSYYFFYEWNSDEFSLLSTANGQSLVFTRIEVLP